MARGNGRAYSIQRLRSAGHDEVADRVERGELSAHRALIEVGLKKEPAIVGTPEQLARAVKRLEYDPEGKPKTDLMDTPRGRFFAEMKRRGIGIPSYLTTDELEDELSERRVTVSQADGLARADEDDDHLRVAALADALDLTFDEHATAILSAPPAARRILLQRWAEELDRRMP